MKIDKSDRKQYPLGTYKEWRKDPAVKRNVSVWRMPGVRLVLASLIAIALFLWAYGRQIWHAMMGIP